MRTKSLVGALLVAALVTAGCAGDDPSGEREGKTELTVQIEGEPEENGVYISLAKSFEDANPDVDVNLVLVGDEGEDAIAKLTTQYAAGDPPEVYLINYREYSQFVARDGIEPIGPHLDDAGIDPDNYFEESLEAFSYGGALQCMPQNISSLVVYYNTALFADASLKHPPSDWDWEDLRAAASDLVEQGAGGIGLEPKLIRLAPFVWSNGGGFVDDPDAPTRFTLDDPASREALAFLVSLVHEGLVPTEEETEAEDLETQFITGKVGMYLGSRRDAAKFREVIGFDWDVAALPVAKEPASILHSDAFCISKGTEPLDAALRFVKHVVGAEAQALGAFSGRLVPSLKSVARSTAFLDPTQPPAHGRVFLQAIPQMQRTPVIPTWPQIEEIGDEILRRAFYDQGYSIDDAIRDLDEQTGPLFEEGGAP
ncbi:MAG: sugar ABC transporter substrate-binding protein [Actinomycetota bacterium]|nr:sugar ABC transporter substrate-binding protein [Actinomycetota bacterium]